MADNPVKRFQTPSSPLATRQPKSRHGSLTAPQPSAIALIDGVEADALPPLPDPAARLNAGLRRWLIVSETASPKALMDHLAPGHGAIMVTDLSSARFRIRLHGASGRNALQSGAAIDLGPAACPAGHSAPIAFRDIPLVLHVVQPDTLDLYVPRSYAASVWEWLDDAHVDPVPVQPEHPDF